MERVDRISSLSDELLLNVVSQCDPTSSIALKYTSRRFFTLIDPHPNANRNVLTLMILHDNIVDERNRLTPARCLQQRLRDLDTRILNTLAYGWAHSLLSKSSTKKHLPRNEIWSYRWHGEDVPGWWLDVRKHYERPIYNPEPGASIAKGRLSAPKRGDGGWIFCLHLLRLRASAKKVREWRQDRPPSREMAILHNQGWTSYLRALAPPKHTLDILSIGSVARSRQCVLMEQIYDIAALDEALVNGALSSPLASEVLLELNRQLVMATMDASRLSSLFDLSKPKDSS